MKITKTIKNKSSSEEEDEDEHQRKRLFRKEGMEAQSLWGKQRK